MSKILFINGNLHGHINPTIPVVKELVQRGEEVYYFSTKEFQQKLEAAGAIFMDYGDDFNHFLQNFRPHGNHPFYTLMEYMLSLDRAVVPIILKRISGLHFDCIIHDVMFGGGNIIAKQLKVSAIASCSSFIMEKPPLPSYMLEAGYHPQLDYLLDEIRVAKVEWDMEELQLKDVFFKRASKVLVYTSRLFQPLGDTYNDSYWFVGPSITNRDETLDFPIDTRTYHKRIYISMGTITNNCVVFYQKCFDAFKNTNYQVVLSVGSKTDINSLQGIPDNFMVKNYIPQLEILKCSNLMISHCGLNSVSEALYYGVPIIAIPMTNDQPAVAKQITALGAGLELNMMELSSVILRKTVDTILSDPRYKERCDVIRKTFLLAGGYKKATDEIIHHISSIC